MTYVYIARPRQVGSKDGKSTVIGIPSKLVKTYKINRDTAFEVQVDEITETVTLRKIRGLGEKNNGQALAKEDYPNSNRNST